MNLYVNLMIHVIDYIEENIQENITLTSISGKFNISEYHFDRLFNTIVGKSLKQYILGRKLTTASHKLNFTNESIIEVALNLGFEYPEVFSRAFKKQFGMSPSDYRNGKPKLKTVDKAEIIPREIMNYMGGVTIKAYYSYLEPLLLTGISIDVDVNDSNYGSVLKQESDRFLTLSQNLSYLDHDKFYSTVSCHGDGGSQYTVFSGKRVLQKDTVHVFKQRVLPGGWYAGFVYQGDMIEIRSDFEKDLFRWIAMKEIALNPNGIGMISIYDQDYPQTQIVNILIPVKSPQ
jgi:AraC family transcriptional regulator